MISVMSCSMTARLYAASGGSTTGVLSRCTS